MPATPAWPPRSAPRLCVASPLADGVAVAVEGNAAHYLGTVMRVQPGDAVLLFNGCDGEWTARVESASRRSVLLVCVAQTKVQEVAPDFWLCAAPIKKGRIEVLMEKACELGVARILPVLTDRCIVDKLNADRMTAHLVEASEQCGRTAMPELAPLVRLKELLADWPAGRTLFFADEMGGPPAADAFAGHPGPAALLTGPEGGFTTQERALVRAHPAAVPITLGPRILRAETAAIAGTAVWMATMGDWTGNAASCELQSDA